MSRFKGKNILCIYYKFPPIKGIGTLRNFKFYTSLKKDARKIFVLTTSNRNFLPQDQFEYSNHDVIEIPTVDFRTIYHSFTGRKSSLLITGTKSPTNWMQRSRGWFKKSILSRYFDEGGYWYVKSGVKKASKIIEEQGVDVIISSYLPFDSHRMALELKKKYPHLYWVADYRDFIPDSMLGGLGPESYLVRKNKELLHLVDEVTTVSKGLKERIEVLHPNVQVVRNGIDSSLVPKGHTRKYRLFTLAYTGIIYPSAQKADLLVEVVKELVEEGKIQKENIQIVQAGKDGAFWKELLNRYQMGEILVNKNIVPHREAIEIQRKSHINLLLTWASEEMTGILTGKLFEYLASGTPILALVNGIRDLELEEIIQGNSRGKVFYHTDLFKTALKSFVLQKYNKWKHDNNRTFEITDREQKSISNITWEKEFEKWVVKMDGKDLRKSGIK